jgi:CheY-like chemotaxis protein
LAPAPAHPEYTRGLPNAWNRAPEGLRSIIPSVASPSRISTKRYADEACSHGTTQNPPYRVMPKVAAGRETSDIHGAAEEPAEEVPIRVSMTDRRELGPVRVLVVDDHTAFRHALSSALDMVVDIEVAGQAGGGLAACDEAEELEPDVVIMDLSMPDLSGIDAMKRIHERRPDLPVVILTAHADGGVEREAREAGASGFLPKGTALRELVLVLHEAAGLC